MTRLCCFWLLAGAIACFGPAAALGQGTRPARDVHVVVVVFDGLRPDSVTEQDMPNLYALGQAGTRFARHHPVYPSSTEVNGTALATGGYPRHTGIMANNEYRPQIDPLKSTAIEELAAVRKGDAISSGKYIQLPTVAETLRAAGMRTAVAGTKPVALLLDRATARRRHRSTVGSSRRGQVALARAARAGRDWQLPGQGRQPQNTQPQAGRVDHADVGAPPLGRWRSRVHGAVVERSRLHAAWLRPQRPRRPPGPAQ